MMEKRYKPCGSDSCCYTNDREYVEKLENALKEITCLKAENERLNQAAKVLMGLVDEAELIECSLYRERIAEARKLIKA